MKSNEYRLVYDITVTKPLQTVRSVGRADINDAMACSHSAVLATGTATLQSIQCLMFALANYQGVLTRLIAVHR